MLNICVLGTGYVGLVSGTCLAEIGHRVTCVDVDGCKIAALRKGRIPIFEPGLDRMVVRNVAAGRLTFSTELGDALSADTLVLLLAVGTPSGEDGGSADLAPLMGAVDQAARRRAQACEDGFMVFAVKSTVPMGTCAEIRSIVARHLPAERFAVVSNPEFLREGCAIEDFLTPDRIVVGSSCPKGLALMRRLYAPLTERGHVMLEVSSIETSEMIKYASNVFLATKIGLINEFSRLCEAIGADVEELAAGVGMDHRIGPAGLRAGPGFGGSCFPKDLRALVSTAAAHATPMPIAGAVIVSNERQKRSMSSRVRSAFDGDLRGRRIAVLGLSFKAQTDDVREAPPLAIAADLAKGGACVVAFDPVAIANASRLMPGIDFAASAEDAIAGAQAVVLATEWPMFRALDWDRMRSLMQRPLVFDLRNLLDGVAMAQMGFEYVGLGRVPLAPTMRAVAEPTPMLPKIDAGLLLPAAGETHRLETTAAF